MRVQARQLLIAIAALHVLASPAQSAVTSGSPAAGAGPAPKRVEFAREQPSREVRHVADWVAASGDNRGLAFAIIDKTNARIFVFDAAARMLGASPVLLGAARGDHSVPGIGEREMASIRPEERTTPAGRFVAERGRNLNGEDIIWVDYDAAVSMHRVRANNPRQRRLERLASPTPADNRISYGCINIPVAFYNTVVDRAFSSATAIVYVLPEIRTVREVFGSYEVAAPESAGGLTARVVRNSR